MRLRPFSLALALSLVGCSQSHHGDRPLDGTLEWLPAALCARWERCTAGTPWGVEGCDAWMRARLENVWHPSYEHAIELGTARPRDDARALCEARAAGSCDWVATAASGAGLGGLGAAGGLASLSCPDVVEGLVAIDGACALDEECAADATCRTGTCQAPLGEGEPGCSQTFGWSRSDCAAGLTCASDASGSRCERLPAVGDACTSEPRPNCALGGQCVDGACVAVDESNRALGEACGVTTARCEPGLVCESNVCVVAPRAGEPCIGPDGLPTTSRTCGDGLRCAEDGLCAPVPVEGEACVALGGLGGVCAGLLGCVDEICVPARANGEACAVGPECISMRCVDGACAAPFPLR